MSRFTPLFAVLLFACAKPAPATVNVTVAGEVAASPVSEDEATCARLNAPDASEVASAVAALQPRVAQLSAWAGREEDAVRAWCLSAFEQTFYLQGGCDTVGRACEVDACVSWRTAHGARPDDATNTCLQDCNCGE